jgi:hypothetical protein
MDTSFWQKWGLPLLSTPIVLATYVAAGYLFAPLMQGGWGFLGVLALATLASCALVALIGRAAGLYQPGGLGSAEGTAERQGITATQLALIAASFILPRYGVDHSFLLYAAAFLIVGIVGRETFGLIAGQRPSVVATSPVGQQGGSYGR